ncbi:DUF2867 domain-containing protein [Cypionkella sp. TWP1-2-1b2]|uniref:DUF2867 domain-containing protein n=1 Tax=Cypionkella sp. TWP1-2-1b2 TaxID=2804675 RepID=UPI003CF2B95F
MQLPAHAQLIAPQAALAYLDSQSVALPAPVKALQAWRVVMAKPLPGMALAFWLRDAISARFGVARIGGFSGDRVDAPQVGDRLDFFLIEHIDDQVLSLTARDKHLDVMTCVTVEGTQLAITASVVTHNWFGRLYMIPVAPAHKVIVWAMLRRLRRGELRRG